MNPDAGLTPTSDEAAVDLSVLIATRSRADSLERTLESMLAADATGLRWELVIADNGSEDRTPELLQSWTSRLPLRWARIPEPGQNRARNRLIPTLRGRITILSDDDVVVAPDWLQQWKQGAERWPQHDIFGGRIRPRLPESAPAWLRDRRFPFRGQCFAEFDPPQGEGIYRGSPYGPNFAIRTAVLKSHLFREDLGPAAGSYAMGGETELVGRLMAEGRKVVYLPGPCVEHVLFEENLRLEKLYRRGYNAGRGDEYRRVMRNAPPRWRLQLRARFHLPLKIALYAALCRAVRSRPIEQQFRREYKLNSAQGRLWQLHALLSSAADSGAATGRMAME